MSTGTMPAAKDTPAAIGVVDAHVHLWDTQRFTYDWLKGLPSLNRPFMPQELAAASASAGVAKFVFVECGVAPVQAGAEADWVTHLVGEEPRLCGIVAQAPLENGESARAALAALARRPLVKGVRRVLQGEADDSYCLRPEFITGVRSLARYGFTFDICIRHEQLLAVTELVRRVPDVQFVLDHLGKPAIRAGRLTPWAKELRDLAALPHVCCKLSGLTTEADMERWRLEDVKPYVDVMIEAFGYDRILFGGDWPVATLATDYQRWMDTVMTLTASASDDERRKLFRTNAERIYRV